MLNQQTHREETNAFHLSTNWGNSYNEPHPTQRNHNNLSSTPISKGPNAFKSPAPSNKKYMQNYVNKSPLMTTHSRVNGSNQKLYSQANNESWMISPVCSRLREHIYMLNGNA